MISIQDESQCCGCTACESVCAHNAITMKPDALGFLYPDVDISKCVDCGLCERVCSFNDNYDTSLNISPIAYAARHKDMVEIMKSRSGAAFVAISDYILDNGGVVYGAGYKDHFRVAHKRAETKNERDEFRGSKYVQSDLIGVFKQVKEDLKKGIKVLFSGTPCQTAGLNTFIGNNLRQNLVLVDIVCHGVPGPYLWRDYIAYLERKNDDEIIDVDFRNKTLYGWRAHKESFVFKNKGKVIKDTYSYLFSKCIMFRPSCGVCHFANIQRPSDITLADFWGWENNVPSMNHDNKGINLVLLSTDQGRKIFNDIQIKLNTEKVDINKSLQPNLKQPTEIHPERYDFEKNYVKHGFEYVIKRYGKDGWRYKMGIYKSKIIRVIKKVFEQV